jgi:processing peptidase subunit alpha
MIKLLDEFVGSAMTKSNRESLLFSSAILPDQLGKVLALLREVAEETTITPGDLEEMKAVVAYEVGEMEGKAEELIPELVHGPAFYREDCPNGNSILAIPETLDSIRVEDVEAFRRRVWSPERITVIGSGMTIDTLLQAAQEHFSGIGATKISESPSKPLEYVGGSSYLEKGELPLVHVGIGFGGVPAGHEDSYAAAVLQMLLGGGGSFSAGGPGKGMYSRLYMNLLNRYHWLESAKVFNYAYGSAGVFGIHGSAIPSQARELVKVMLGQLGAMGEGLSPAEFGRAKAQVKSAVLMGLESRVTQLEDLADQITHRGPGSYVDPVEICQRIDGVTVEDMRRVADRILASKPTVVAYGPLARMPSYDAILDWIH